MSTPTLADFLLARYADEAAVADDVHNVYVCGDRFFGCECDQPARVRADVAVKRKVVERYLLSSAPEPQLEWVLRTLAEPYRDHPEYPAELL